jgi:hypothetical protein
MTVPSTASSLYKAVEKMEKYSMLNCTTKYTEKTWKRPSNFGPDISHYRPLTPLK